MSIFRSARLKKEMTPEAAEFTSSLSHDYEILKATVWVNSVHLRILYEKHLISREDFEKSLKTLKEIIENPPKELDPRLEDIHVYIEQAIASSSEYAAGMLSYGKSRNDAVATAIRVRAREHLLETALSELDLVKILLEKAREHAYTLFPIYTHLQRAVPATFGFILHSYASKILRNLSNIINLYSRVNLSPLGAGAATGSSTEIDRLREAQLLGFEDLLENALDATTSRDYIITLLTHLLNSALIYSCLAEELILYSTEEFNLIEIPDEYTSTSSIMPQKKNPVVAEIARTKMAEILGEVVKAASIMSRQPSGYNLDYQQVTPTLWKAFNEIKNTSRILSQMIEKIQVNKDRATEKCKGIILLTEIAEKLTQETGITFRKAHQLCGELSILLEKNMLNEETFKEVARRYDVNNIEYQRFISWFDPYTIVSSYKTVGSSNPEEVKKMVEVDIRRAEALREWCNDTLERLDKLFKSSMMI
ncbi:MAG: argininosuccinate lyase [Nitrososphaerota archaeon]|nr:argininosuccinate lyase [Nitrososphaerota archaeon]